MAKWRCRKFIETARGKVQRTPTLKMKNFGDFALALIF
jgi:hypothetical protein